MYQELIVYLPFMCRILPGSSPKTSVQTPNYAMTGSNRDKDRTVISSQVLTVLFVTKLFTSLQFCS